MNRYSGISRRVLKWLERELVAVLAVLIVGIFFGWARADTAVTTFTMTVLPPDGEVADTVTVTAPNGLENWTVGETNTIRWSYTGTFDFVKIELQRTIGGSWETIVASTPNDGAYSWTITGSVLTTQAMVRITNTDDGSVTDSSDARFTIAINSNIGGGSGGGSGGGGGGGGGTTVIAVPQLPSIIQKPFVVFPANAYAARCVAADKGKIVLTAQPGAEVEHECRFLNTGKATLYNYGTNPTRMGVVRDKNSLLRHESWLSSNRVATIAPAHMVTTGLAVGEEEVKPGEIGVIKLKLRAPEKPGVYKENFALVAEYTTWIPNTQVQVQLTVKKPVVTKRSTVSNKSVPKAPVLTNMSSVVGQTKSLYQTLSQRIVRLLMPKAFAQTR